jgi:two-component system, NarL family, invasion response regulator UvrY
VNTARVLDGSSAGKDGHEVKPMILIVEDHTSVRTLLCSWLGMIFPGCSFLTAESGEEAVSKASSARPGIVLMDIGLPGINGIEATKEIVVLLPDVKVVMLTILDDPEYRRDAEKAGACAYVTKGRMHADLVPIVKSLIEKASGGSENPSGSPGRTENETAQ